LTDGTVVLKFKNTTGDKHCMLFFPPGIWWDRTFPMVRGSSRHRPYSHTEARAFHPCNSRDRYADQSVAWNGYLHPVECVIKRSCLVIHAAGAARRRTTKWS